MKPMSNRRHELLSGVAAVGAAVAGQFKTIDKDAADQIGAAIADALARDWAGQTIYYPSDASYQLTPRDRAMLEAHRRGRTIAELALEHRISEQWVRELLKRAQNRDADLNQAQLPLPPA